MGEQRLGMLDDIGRPGLEQSVSGHGEDRSKRRRAQCGVEPRRLSRKPLHAGGDREQHHRHQVHRDAAVKRILARDSGRERDQQRAGQDPRDLPPLAEEDDDARHRQREKERGERIAQQRGIAEQGHPAVREPLEGRARLPGHEPLRPEGVHERLGRRGHAVAAGDDRGHARGGPQGQSYQECALQPAVARAEPAHREGEPDPSHQHHGRLRKPDDDGARQPERDPLADGGLACAQLEREEHHQDGRGRVGLVLLDLRAVADERHAHGKQRQRERRGQAFERTQREAAKEDERGDAHDEREEPERMLARPERQDHQLLDEKKGARRHLVEPERLEQELAHRQPENVPREEDLVQPKRRGAHERPDPQGDPQAHEHGHAQGAPQKPRSHRHDLPRGGTGRKRPLREWAGSSSSRPP